MQSDSTELEAVSKHTARTSRQLPCTLLHPLIRLECRRNCYCIWSQVHRTRPNTFISGRVRVHSSSDTPSTAPTQSSRTLHSSTGLASPRHCKFSAGQALRILRCGLTNRPGLRKAYHLHLVTAASGRPQLRSAQQGAPQRLWEGVLLAHRSEAGLQKPLAAIRAFILLWSLAGSPCAQCIVMASWASFMVVMTVISL